MRSLYLLGRSFRPIFLALLVHLLFFSLFGLSFQLQPEVAEAQVIIAIDSQIVNEVEVEKEEMRKLAIEKDKQEKIKRQARQKEIEKTEEKRKADLAKRQEAQREIVAREAEEKKKREAF